MNQKVLLLLLLVAVLAFTVLLVRTQTEGFTGVLPDDVVEAGQERFNKFMNLVNLANSPIPLNPTTADAVDSATNSLSSSPSGNGGGVTPPFKVPTAPSPNLGVAQGVCEVVTTPDCSAFQTPAFAANCGISFDIKGKDSKGNPHREGSSCPPRTGPTRNRGRPRSDSAPTTSSLFRRWARPARASSQSTPPPVRFSRKRSSVRRPET